MDEYPTQAGNAYIGNEVIATEQAHLRSRNTTLAENIEIRIASLRDEIERLAAVRDKLSRGELLDVPIEDLRRAMQY